MSDPFADQPCPKPALVSAALLVGFTVLAVTVARLTGLGGTEPLVSVPVESRDLRFEDRADGAVAVIDSTALREVAVLAPGSNNFIRGALRGLVRERKRQDIGMQPAFRLTRWADGRLTIEDPATARTIDLGAFGPTNAQSFAMLLEGQGGSQ